MSSHVYCRAFTCIPVRSELVSLAPFYRTTWRSCGASWTGRSFVYFPLMEMTFGNQIFSLPLIQSLISPVTLHRAIPGCLGSLGHFRSQFSDPIEQGQRHSATKRALATGRKRVQALVRKISPWFLRRTKALIEDQLPKKDDRVGLTVLLSLHLPPPLLNVPYWDVMPGRGVLRHVGLRCVSF